MRDPAQFLEKSLSEHGMSVDTISHESDVHRDIFYISKTIAGEKYSMQFGITEEAQHVESLEKQIAMNAQRVANEFKGEMVDTVKIGYRCIRLCPYDNGWAECLECGTRVEFPENRSGPFAMDAELSTPQPYPLSREQSIESLSPKQRVSLKMYLAGRLRDRCDHDCQNSRLDRKT